LLRKQQKTLGATFLPHTGDVALRTSGFVHCGFFTLESHYGYWFHISEITTRLINGYL